MYNIFCFIIVIHLTAGMHNDIIFVSWSHPKVSFIKLILNCIFKVISEEFSKRCKIKHFFFEKISFYNSILCIC